MDTKDVFIKTVEATLEIPEGVRANASHVEGWREDQMTQSYIDFLDRESHHNPRGPKWEGVMKERRTRMLPYLNAQWAAGLIRSEGRTYYVMVATESQVVIHWEEF